MWNNIISFYIFFKKLGKTRLKRSHKGKKQTLCENPTLNVIQSMLRSKKLKVHASNSFKYVFLGFT
jgi:hypothetical protein